jgi:hypothetical protein
MPHGQLQSEDENLQRLWTQMIREMPDATAATPGMRPPSGWWERMLMGGDDAIAKTMPFSKEILYNPDTLARETRPIDTLRHELTHVREYEDMGPLRKLGSVLAGVPQAFMSHENRPQEQHALREEDRMYREDLDRARTGATGPMSMPPAQGDTGGAWGILRRLMAGRPERLEPPNNVTGPRG